MVDRREEDWRIKFKNTWIGKGDEKDNLFHNFVNHGKRINT
jgi:hypothetical protein